MFTHFIVEFVHYYIVPKQYIIVDISLKKNIHFPWNLLCYWQKWAELQRMFKSGNLLFGEKGPC